MASSPTPLAARNSRNRALVRSLAERGTLWSQSRRSGIAGMFASVAAKFRARRDRDWICEAITTGAYLSWPPQTIAEVIRRRYPQPEAPEGTPATTFGERRDLAIAYRILRGLGWERKREVSPFTEEQYRNFTEDLREGENFGVINVKGLGDMKRSMEERAFLLGRRIPSLTWWYTPHPQLGCSPRDAVDAMRFDEVESLGELLPDPCQSQHEILNEIRRREIP